MKSVVKKMLQDQSIIEFHTATGTKKLEINATTYGYSYEDFSQWNISDEEYYRIEEVVDRIIDEMSSEDELVYDFD
jgi:hypothetical protein